MPTRTYLRRIAAVVLLLWLFGLASGVANACLVGVGLRHVGYAAALEAAHAHSSEADGVAAAAPAMQPVHEHGDGEHPPCKRLCDEPLARTQGEKQPSTALSAVWLAAAPLPIFEQWPPCEASSPVARAELDVRTAIPIAIAYLRLTL